MVPPVVLLLVALRCWRLVDRFCNCCFLLLILSHGYK